MRSRGSWFVVMMGLLFMLGLVPGASAAPGQARLRVVHASPDAPAMDVYVDGGKVLSNVAFFKSSDYLDLAPGEHRFQVTLTGQPADAALIDTSATVAADRAYSVIASGKLAAIKATILADNLAAPASGKANVRVIHLSPDTPAADLKVKGGQTLVAGLEFSRASDYLPVDPGSLDLVMTQAGSDQVALDLPGAKFEAGKVYDVFAVGFSNGQPKLRAETAVAPAAGNSSAPAATAAATTPASAPTTAAATTATPGETAVAGNSTSGVLLPSTGNSNVPFIMFTIMAMLLIGGGVLLRRRTSE